ncbi:MAG: alpha/beta hydrolase [Nitrospirae bacterium GWD2_57_9]|nr:MAG: alpha/beta hydrolase [Nitrospirae bacterium GWD2_57_9]
MPSLRSRLFLSVLRNRHLLKFKLKKETAHDWETSLPEVRASAAKTSKLFGKLPKGLEAVPVAIGDLPAEWIQPAQDVTDRVILYFHGGGYILGSIEAHRGIVAKFVRGSGARALLHGYRLAPEHRFPAALDDSVAAYRWLLSEGISPAKIVFAGDSAGGGLCLATLLAVRDRGIPLPAAAVALSPWTDLKNTGESLRTNAAKCLAPTNSWVVCANHYLGNQDPGNPYASPLYGDLRGLPPLFICAGGDETVRDDSTRFARKAKDAGVDVTLKVGEGMCHCYPACAPLFPEATQAMVEICTFIKTHIDKH